MRIELDWWLSYGQKTQILTRIGSVAREKSECSSDGYLMAAPAVRGDRADC